MVTVYYMYKFYVWTGYTTADGLKHILDGSAAYMCAYTKRLF